MARIFTDALLAELPNRIPDNETGLVMPADVRQAIQDSIESLRPAYSLLSGNHEATALTVSLNNATWTKIAPLGLFTVVKNSDVNELQANIATADLEVKFGGFVHLLQAQLSMFGPNGRILDLAIGESLVPVGQFTTIELLGAGTWQECAISASSQPAVGTKYDLIGKWYGGAASDTLSIVGAKFLGELSTSRRLT